MFWREDERKKLWDRNQVRYSEIAHEYLCCRLPTIKMCLSCYEREFIDCPNRKEADESNEMIILATMLAEKKEE